MISFLGHCLWRKQRQLSGEDRNYIRILRISILTYVIDLLFIFVSDFFKLYYIYIVIFSLFQGKVGSKICGQFQILRFKDLGNLGSLMSRKKKNTGIFC